jgi:hypothetical protein
MGVSAPTKQIYRSDTRQISDFAHYHLPKLLILRGIFVNFFNFTAPEIALAAMAAAAAVT